MKNTNRAAASLETALDAARRRDTAGCIAAIDQAADLLGLSAHDESGPVGYAAHLAFRRVAFVAIDLQLEDELADRVRGASPTKSTSVLKIAHQLFLQLGAQDQRDPVAVLTLLAEHGRFGDPEAEDFDVDGYTAARDDAFTRSLLWRNEDSVNRLTLLFNATADLPRNTIRTLIVDADNAFRTISLTDDLLAAAYSLALYKLGVATADDLGNRDLDAAALLSRRIEQVSVVREVTIDYPAWRGPGFLLYGRGAVTPLPEDRDELSDEVMGFVYQWIREAEGDPDLAEGFWDYDWEAELEASHAEVGSTERVEGEI